MKKIIQRGKLLIIDPANLQNCSGEQWNTSDSINGGGDVFAKEQPH